MVKKWVECFPLKLGTSQECLFSPLLFNIILDIALTGAVRQEEETAGIQTGKKINSLYFQMPRSWM